MSTARDWILVLFGRFVRGRGGWVPVRQMVDLLEPLGADPASVRTAISRLKRAGFIESIEHLGMAGYSLTSEGEAFFADGDRRILERRHDGDRWVLASFSVPESQRSVRYKIRARLLELGFGQESAGLLIAPEGLMAEAERALRRESLDEWVSLWLADFGSLGSISTIVERSWDVGALHAMYDSYVVAASAALAVASTDDASTFVRYVRLVNQWRELQYADPGLPQSALGDEWPQPVASALFEEVESMLYPAAGRHYDAVFTTATSGAPASRLAVS